MYFCQFPLSEGGGRTWEKSHGGRVGLIIRAYTQLIVGSAQSGKDRLKVPERQVFLSTKHVEETRVIERFAGGVRH